MINFLLILTSFIIIITSIKLIISEKHKSNFDYIINYKLEEEDMELSNNIVDITTKKEDKIKQLINKGYKDDEICNELNIGRGELLLIKKCYKIS
jgi:DNA-binding NarL/FixJ family response regulator